MKQFIYESENPDTYIEVINSKENLNWKKTMDIEITSLKENDFWSFLNLPEEAKPISSK